MGIQTIMKYGIACYKKCCKVLLVKETCTNIKGCNR
jgi:hypothetical protein